MGKHTDPLRTEVSGTGFGSKIAAMKRTLVVMAFAVFILAGFGCATVQEKGPQLTVQQRIDSARVWYSIGKDDLLKAIDGRGDFQTAIGELKRAYGYTLAKDTTGMLDSLRKEITLDIAYAFLKAKEVDSAERYYKSLIEMDSSDHRGWQGLGFIYGIVRQDYAKGEEYYKKALELSPDNPDVLFGLARVYEKQGKVDKAYNLYKEALNRKPDNAGLNRSFGKFLYEIKRYDEAIPYLEKAAEKKKDDKDLLDMLLKAYMEAHKSGKDVDLGRALEYANRLIELADTLEKYKYYMKRAKLYENLGKKKEAIADYEKAVEMNPQAKVALVKVAYLYDDLGMTAQAEKTAKRVVNDPDIEKRYKAAAWMLLGDIRQKRAIALYKKKKYEQAVSTFDSALAAYQQAALLGEGKVKTYAQKQIDRVKKWRKKAWRKWKRID